MFRLRPASLRGAWASAFLASASAASSALAQNLPTGGSVAAGTTTTATAGTTLTIDQSSQNAIMNWQSFSIGLGYTVQVNQPNASSALLNRVTGGTPSTIAGQLNANGQVYLINPNGIAITKSGVVTIGGGFVASTLDISDAEFMSGGRRFTGSGASAGVSNAGTITVGRGGYAALLGGTVNNSGLISVPMGKVGLGSGEVATLDVSGDGFLQVAVPTQAGGQDALVQSSGTIKANGGLVVMTAATARAAARNAVNISGDVEAHSISGHAGEIILGGGEGGSVAISGKLDVSGGKHTTGGAVTVTGENIALMGATIKASGGTGGGSVRIGGDQHGGGTLPQAVTVTINAESVIDADATGTGNGGSVVVWSDQETDFAGLITAEGGALGGNGGDAEVSSEGVLAYDGFTNLSAAQGTFGDLLLDPYSITISTGTDTTSSGFTASGNNSVINVTTLQNALGGGNVTVSTGSGGNQNPADITVATAVTWSAGTTLTLQSYHSIAIDAPISITGAGGLVLTTNNGGSGGTLTFGTGLGSPGSVQFTDAGASGRSLVINGTTYTLVDTMTELDEIDALSAVDGSSITPYGSGLAGNYALAVPLTATGTTYTTALIAPGGTGFTGIFEGLGNTISGLTISNGTGGINLGLFGTIGTAGTVRDVGLLGGSVTGTYGSATTGNYTMGDLVGSNNGAILQSYATGSVTITQADAGDYIGGLAGVNNTGASITSSFEMGNVGNNDNAVAGGQIGGLVGGNAGTISQCFATGAVSDKDNGVGGLVGFNINGTITNSYATGEVLGTTGGASAGGLVGNNSSGTISNCYSTGVVISSGSVGGLVDNSYNGGGGAPTITNSYWDTTTSGVSSSASGSTGESFSNMQGSTVLSNLGSAFGGGTNLYPYLKSIFPNGVQAVTGTAFSDAGVTHLASTSSGPVLVTVTANGVFGGTVTTSAAGFYYLAAPAGTFTSSTATLAYTTAPTSSQDGANLQYDTGVTGLDIYGTRFYDNNAATTYSTAGIATVLAYSTTPTFIASLPEFVQTSGASFTFDQALTLSTSLSVNAYTTSAPITVAAPITVPGSDTLTLTAAGKLTINANITVPSTGTVALSYNTAATTNFNFGLGDSVQFTGTAGAGQALTINGNSYTLVYTMANLDAIDGLNAASSDASETVYGPGLTGRYALAVPLTATGTTYTDAPVAIGGNSSIQFTGTFEGLGNTITGLTVSKSTSSGNDAGLFGYLGLGGTVRDIGVIGGTVSISGSGSVNIGGLVGRSDGAVINSYATTAVNMTATSGTDLEGGLVGDNFGSITQSFATGAVVGGNSANIGGLVGRDEYSNGGYVGTITQSYATGAVTGGTSSSIGGLSGIVWHGASVTSSYATGAVTGGSSSDVGGLIGQLYSSSPITLSYSTGAVTGSGATVGGFVGLNSGTVTSSYWDTMTSGTSTGFGSGTASGATGETTQQLQGTTTVSLGSAFSGGAAGGTSGLYPYLTALDPNGVQAVSGTAYKDAGVSTLASSTSGPGLVAITVGGVAEGSVTTGANGYYYIALPSGTISGSGSNVLAYTASANGDGAANGDALASATGTVTGLNIYGGYTAYPTSAVLYSALGGFSSLATTVEGYSTSPSFVSTQPFLILATGASFTFDQTLSLTSNLALTTTATNAPITVAAPITVPGSDTLTLTAAGSLTIDANITVPSTGTVALTYNTGAVTNFSFGAGDSLQFTGTANSGQALTINGNSYTLVYTMANLDAIDGINAVNDGSVTTYGSGLTGRYALAVPLTATGTTYTYGLIGTDSSGSTTTQFTGTFEGLGNTVTGLTISNSGSNYGLFGYIGTGGTVRDLGVVGGSVSGTGSTSTDIGDLAGVLAGTIVGSYATGAVNISGTASNNFGGGLVGLSDGIITTSYATGALTGGVAQNDGGLVGRNTASGTISYSYATGSVTAGGQGGLGGLVGKNDSSNSVIEECYATGAVTASNTGNPGDVGGLVGQNTGIITESYATGALSNASGSSIGGIVSSTANNGTISSSYWDTQTTGTSNALTGATGETTAQMQGTATVALTGFSGGIAGGTSGVYPYLTVFDPNGVQAVSGIAYKDAGVTTLASGASGVGVVAVTIGGVAEGSVTTGANGYYYLALPSGTISGSGSNVLAYTASANGDGAANGDALTSATGTVTGLNVYGGYTAYSTSAVLYSALGSSSLLTTVEGYSSTPSFVSTLPSYLLATGASFTFDQTLSLSSSLVLKTTTANAPITIAAPITLNGSNTLTLSAAGALNVDANVTVPGTGTVNLAYNTAAATNFRFGPGDSLQFTGTPNSGQALTINGTSYTLIYTMSQLDAADGVNAVNNATETTYGAGLAGDYALAVPLTATGTTYEEGLIGTSSSSNFSGIFDGLGNSVSGLTITSSNTNVGLFGYQSGTVRDLSLVGGTVSGSGANSQIGALVGYNSGTVVFCNASTAVNSSSSTSYAGDLLGEDASGTVTGSYATGAVSGAANFAGGLIGYDSSGTVSLSYDTGSVADTNSSSDSGGFVGYVAGSTFSESYATGAVDGAYGAGGFVGNAHSGTFTQCYATGVVTGGFANGGFADYVGSASFTNSYWDQTTSGQTYGARFNTNLGGVTGEGTGSLQGSLPSGFSSTYWSTGTGLYPYLNVFYPNGVQAISGIAYKDAGVTPLASGSSGAGLVTVTVGGVAEGSVTTGANGYYYLAVPSGTISGSGSNVLAYTASANGDGAANGDTVASATGTVAGLNVYGGYTAYSTSAVLYSALGSSSLLTTVEAYSTTPSFVPTLPSFLLATGASFTIDQSLSLTSNFAVETTATNAPITVSAPITLSGSNTLTLNAAGTLNVDANVTVTGTGTVNLAYNTGVATNFSFGAGDSLQFTGTNGNGTPQGTLTINSSSYTLVDSMSELDAIDAVNAVTGAALTQYGPGTAGKYALAVPLTATGTTYIEGLVSTSNSNPFTGIFEGLGNSVTGLTINSSLSYVGLFADQSGTVRDLGLIGGGVSGSNTTGNVGALVGFNAGTLAEDYATGSVTETGTNSYAGGLVAWNSNGTIIASYAAGAVNSAGAASGGLIGYDNSGNDSLSFATGSVTGTNSANGAAGGFVGLTQNSTISECYAMGAVTGAYANGGFVATNRSGSTINECYATGVVAGGSLRGGFASWNNGGTITSSYWDTLTSGTSTGIALGTNSGATGYNTTQLQGTVSASLGSAFTGGAAGGASGIYPYLANFYPNGVQAISGLAYKDAGVTPLASGSSGAGLVSVTIGGVAEGTASTGANGYYYLAVPSGTISGSGSNVLAYTASANGDGAANGDTVTSVTGTVTGLNVYGGYTTYPTSAVLYSALGSSSLLTTVEGYSSTPSFVSTLPSFLIATGASFTIDQSLTLTSNLAVETTATNAPITVSAPITLSGSNTLILSAAGKLNVDANVTVTGTGTVNLTYNSGAATNLDFALGDSLQFTGTNGDGTPQGTLSIQGSTYTLVDSMSELDAIDALSATGGANPTQYGPGLAGRYALATSLNASGTIYTTGLVAPTSASAFTGTFEGLGNTISNLGITSTSLDTGLFGYSSGTLRDFGLVGGAVSGTSSSSNFGVGALVGDNAGTVVYAYAGTAVTGSDSNSSSYAGGLVGINSGTITQSFATGAVSSTSSTSAGGLAGSNSSTITQSYATGLVGAATYYAGGLVGYMSAGTVTQSYSIGVVTGNASGGFVGAPFAGTFTSDYFDQTTSGQTYAGSGHGTPSGVTGDATGTMQSSATATALGSAYAGGSGLYPYLVSFYPNGVQTISGIAYKDAGSTPLASGTSGAGLVSVTISGVAEGTVTTGVNGYYYVAVPSGTISGSGSNVLAYTASANGDGAANAAAIASATGSLSNFNIYGGEVAFQTSATLYSQLGSVGAYSAVTGYGTTPSFVSGLGDAITTTGASFTFDQTLTLSSSFSVATTGSAPIIVAAPITLQGTNSLTLSAAGKLTVDAPITVTGAGTVALSYSTSSATNFTFALGDGLQFTGTANSGQALTINGNSYTLVYTMANLDAIDALNGVTGGALTQYGPGLAGRYALAVPLTATGTTYANALVGSSSSNFTGTFEGLGNTVTGLTISSSGSNVGLFGYVGSAGTVRDLGEVGGTISGAGSIGGLVGANAGTVANSYASATVTASNGAGGGLVGYNGPSTVGTIINSFATGAVSATYGAGGLAGQNGVDNSGFATITQSYATGAVYGYNAGGLVGRNASQSTISDSYATGAVSGTGYLGGVIGYSYNTQSGVYWDKTTSGQTNTNSTGNVTSGSETTAQMQGSTTVSLAGFSGGIAGGTSGIYPYLTSFFPNGVQAISGIAYTNGGTTALASGSSGAAFVSVAANGTVLGTVSTGANGYYYTFVPSGTLTSGADVVAYTQTNSSTGAHNAVSFAQSTGGTTLTNLNVDGGWQVDNAGSGFATLSSLATAVATAEGSTAPASFSLTNLEIDSTAATFSFDQSITLSGTLAISSTGTVSETNGTALTSNGLLLTGTGGAYTLNGSNDATSLAASTGSVSFNNAGAFTTGSVSNAAGTSTAGVTTSGTVTLVTAGNLTLGTGAAVSGQSPVLAAGGTFFNDAGSTGVTATSGRWLIYSAGTSSDVFDNLNSAHTAIFDQTYSSLPPGNVTANGSRYIFAAQPVLTVTSTNDQKNYGVDDTTAIESDYTIAGFPTASGAFVTDTASTAVTSGTVSVTSTGSGASAGVASSPYAMAVTGTLTSNAGYTFNYVSSGELTVNPLTITVVGATGVNKTYDTTRALANDATGFTYSGVLSGDTNAVTVTAGSALYASAAAGSENVNVTGLTLGGTASTNYVLSNTSVTGSGLIGQATITVAGATGVDKIYDGTTALPNGATGFTYSGVFGSDAGNLTITATSAVYANAAAGPENVDVTGLTLGGTASGNYQLSAFSVTGSGTIMTMAVPVSAATASAGGVLASTAEQTAFNTFGHPADDMPVLATTAGESSAASDLVETLGNPAFDETLVCVNGLYIATSPFNHHHRRHWH